MVALLSFVVPWVTLFVSLATSLKPFDIFLVPEVDFFVASAVFLAALAYSFAAFAVSSVAVVKCFTAEARQHFVPTQQHQ